MTELDIIPGQKYKHDWFWDTEYLGKEEDGRKFLIVTSHNNKEVVGIEQLNANDIEFWSKFHLVDGKQKRLRTGKTYFPIQIRLKDKTG